ncbi:MAG: ParB/RepB/Spo0J family partition protein [Pseudomonadota bacterium]
MASKNRSLGRGISALMGDVGLDGLQDAPPPRPDRALPIEDIAPNPDQPRKTFDSVALEELASSIRTKGILQPLIVRPVSNEAAPYQIVAGERRWRAAQVAQLHEIPVIVRDLSDVEVLELAIIENIQRADLDPVEEARGYRDLIDRFGHTQEQLSQSLGKSRSAIANALRLLTLPDEVLEHVMARRLSAGHARALITAQDPAALARRVIEGGLSVRDTEKLAKAALGDHGTNASKASAPAPTKDSDTRALEQDLSANLRMTVSITYKDGTGAGELAIRYRDLDQLDTLCRMLSAMRPDESI